MAKAKKCICDDMQNKTLYGEAISFRCPEHGDITIDRRLNFTQPTVPMPAMPSPTLYPWGTPWPAQTICGTVDVGSTVVCNPREMQISLT